MFNSATSKGGIFSQQPWMPPRQTAVTEEVPLEIRMAYPSKTRPGGSSTGVGFGGGTNPVGTSGASYSGSASGVVAGGGSVASNLSGWGGFLDKGILGAKKWQF